MKVIILVAGLGTRLGELTKDTPKCLIKVGSKTILEHQLEILKKAGIKGEDITVVIGNEGSCWTKENQDEIKKLNENIIINYDNLNTNNTHSLKLAMDKMNSDELLIFDGDLAFSSELIHNLVQNKDNLILAKQLRKEDIGNKILVNKDNKVLDISRDLKSNIVYGGFIKLNKDHFESLKVLINKNDYYHLDLGFVLQELCKSINLSILINDNWININAKEDLKDAENIFQKRFLVMMFGYTAVGKSTAAKRIAQIPNTEIFHSAFIRKELNLTPKTKEEADKFFDYRNNIREEVDKKVYGKLAENAATALKNGKNVVLDAGYFFSWQRQLVYEKVKQLAPEVFILKVICPNEEEIKRRIDERASKFNDNLLNETPSWNTYIATKMITEPLEKDTPPENIPLNIINYDTLSKEIKTFSKINSDNSTRIISALSSEVS